jgi:hypothetical protein
MELILPPEPDLAKATPYAMEAYRSAAIAAIRDYLSAVFDRCETLDALAEPTRSQRKERSLLADREFKAHHILQTMFKTIS